MNDQHGRQSAQTQTSVTEADLDQAVANSEYQLRLQEASRHPIVVPDDVDAGAALSRAPRYVDASWRLLPEARDVPDVDAFSIDETAGWALGPDGEPVLVHRVLRAESRTLITLLLDDHSWAPRELTDEQAAALLEDEFADGQGATLDVLLRLWHERVAPRLRGEGERIAARIVAEPGFSLDWQRISLLVEKAVVGEPRIGYFVEDAIMELLHRRNYFGAEEARAKNTAKRYLSALSPAEMDRHYFFSFREIEAALSEFTSRNGAVVPAGAAREVRERVRGRNPTKRYATVGRALMGAGMSKSEVAHLLGIRTAALTDALTASPEDWPIAADDPLRDLVGSRVALDAASLSEEELEERRLARQAERLAAHRAQVEADRARSAVDVDRIAGSLLQELDEWALDSLALSALRDRAARIGEWLPDLPEAARPDVAYRVVTRLRRQDPEVRLRRYGAAVNALLDKGATRTAAARHLRISSANAKLAQEHAAGVTLAEDDYLNHVIATW